MPISDWLVGITEGGLSLNPAAAAFLAAYNSISQAGKNRAIETAVDVLRERLNDLGRRVDAEFAKRDETQASVVINQCVQIIYRTEEVDKIRAAVNILINPSLKDGDPEKLQFDELKHFARCLDSLTVEALHVLRELVKIKRHVDVTTEAIMARLGYSEDLTVGLIKQLESCDFVILQFGQGRMFDKDPHTIRVRPMARKFVDYILDAGSRKGSASAAATPKP